MHYEIKHYLLFVCLILICGLLLYQTNTDIENKTVDQINSEQLVHARQAENTIVTFFESFNNSLFFLSENPHIITLDSEGIRMMHDYYVTHNHEISSITRVDKNGIIQYSYPNESSIGVNISNQAHVRQVIKTREKVISDVFTSVQGYQAVAFHVPVFSDGVFNGSIALLIPFDDLAKKSLEKIRVLDSGYAFAVSEKGTILYSPHPGQTGRSIYEIFNTSPTILALVERAITGEEGAGTYVDYPWLPGQTGLQKFHAIYRPVDIGDQSWSIIIATPEAEIFSSLQTFSRDLAIIAIIIIGAILVFAYYYAKARSILQEAEKRRKVEDALRESEKNYRTIFESIQDVFYRADLDGNLIMMSPSGVSLFGYSSIDELVGKNVAETFYRNPADRDRFIDAVRQNGSVRNYEVTLKSQDGNTVLCRTSSHLFYNDYNMVIGVEGIFHDITSEKMTHTALEQALKKLNLLNAVTFSEIQNSVFVIAGYFDLIKSSVTDPVLVELLEKEEALTRIIISSLDFAKDYQGLGMKPPVWQQVMQTFLFGISHTDISAFSRTTKVEHLEIFADPQLEKVFYVLAENLIHHSQATHLSLFSEKTEEGLILVFEDDGIGVLDSEKELIFGRGYGARKGMGLFLSREILGITNILIRETGIAGTGARFEIVIPPGLFRFTEPTG